MNILNPWLDQPIPIDSPSLAKHRPEKKMRPEIMNPGTFGKHEYSDFRDQKANRSLAWEPKKQVSKQIVTKIKIYLKKSYEE